MERVTGGRRFEPWHLALAGWFSLAALMASALPETGNLAALLSLVLVVPLVAAIPRAARPPGDQLRELGWMYLLWTAAALVSVASLAVARTLPDAIGGTFTSFAALVWALDLAFLVIPGITVLGIGLSTWRLPRAEPGVELARAMIVGSFLGAIPALGVAALSLGLMGQVEAINPGQLVLPLPFAAGGSALLVAWGLAFWWRTSRVTA